MKRKRHTPEQIIAKLREADCPLTHLRAIITLGPIGLRAIPSPSDNSAGGF